MRHLKQFTFFKIICQNEIEKAITFSIKLHDPGSRFILDPEKKSWTKSGLVPNDLFAVQSSQSSESTIVSHRFPGVTMEESRFFFLLLCVFWIRYTL